VNLRLATVVLVAACRLHFEDVPADAPADAPALELTCNTPVQIAEGTASSPRLSAAATRTRIIASWIADDGSIASGAALVLSPTQVYGFTNAPTAGGPYTAVSLAATPDVLLAAFVGSGTGGVRLFDDATGATIGGPTVTPIEILGPRGAAPTGNAGDPLFAIVGNSTATTRSEIAGVNGDGSVATSVDSGNINALSTIVNVGNRLAVVDIPPASNCEAKTADLAVTSRTTTVGWGTNGQCSQGTLVYSPGRADALLVRHDAVDNDLNHAIATRSGMNYAIGPEMRLRTPASEPRGVGVADGYWVAYETAGTLEAAHVDFAGTVGTVVPLGPVATATGHDVVIENGEPYAVWLANGLELAHLCP
jgi:hypothetical protein